MIHLEPAGVPVFIKCASGKYNFGREPGEKILKRGEKTERRREKRDLKSKTEIRREKRDLESKTERRREMRDLESKNKSRDEK